MSSIWAARPWSMSMPDPHGLVTVRLFGEHSYAVSDQVVMRPDMARAFHFGRYWPTPAPGPCLKDQT